MKYNKNCGLSKMEFKLEKIVDKIKNENSTLVCICILREAFDLHGVSSSANDFEKDLFKLINDYCNQGLKKPDLVKKMEWILGSCKIS